MSYGTAATVGPLPEDPGFAEDPALQARRFIEIMEEVYARGQSGIPQAHPRLTETGPESRKNVKPARAKARAKAE